MICPYCGTDNNHGELFCTECGGQLTNSPVNAVSAQKPEKGPAEGLVPGASLQNGRYVMVKALGEGGMGSVLLAKDTRLADKLMVVKVLSAESTDTEKLEEDVRNFKREAETLAHLTHPLIPDVTDHFEEGRHYYMVMSYVEGENLEHWLERTNQPMKEQDALRYALEVLDILEYLSKQQPAIVHRDIKPANLIVGAKDKHVHLVDFGIARANTMIGSQRRKTTALGTPGYAPPEQYQGYADPRSDLYALAATLHHLVTNRDPGEYAPFQFPPIRSLSPRLSPQLERILIKALKTNASERYQTPQEMRQELESLLAGTSTIGVTDSYRLNDSTPLRALPPQPQRKQPAGQPHATANPSWSPVERRRPRPGQSQGYLDPDYYEDEQEPAFQQSRPIFQQPRPFQQYMSPPQQQNPYGYRNNLSREEENQIMWRFILFIVAVCIIGLIAYLLFSSIRFY